ncbi:helix-turn-helix domain-containing protein [Streptomyces sp. NPDC087422]|uniref:helix-turn-helix domain-containing protein n=1 Tax=Streptomyces sp. NPDC087422 TaxID=3365786 RepID=UPI0037FBDD42
MESGAERADRSTADGGTTDGRARALAVVLDAAVGEQAVDPYRLDGALADLGVTGGAAAGTAERLYRLRRDQLRLRRREHELTALFSSARELAEERDADALLARLVERAHDMIDSDVTYLSEFDAASMTLRVRKTAGSVSPRFQRLVVPPGRGLASLVVGTRAAQWVTRYEDDSAGWHEDSLSEAVAAEGLVSLLGVPLLSDEDVLGVLFVGTRDEHAFTPEQVALLSALANHASVVLQTAQRLQRLQRSQEEARDALERLREHLVERDRANAVHQQLIRSVLEDSDFSPIAEKLAEALDRAVAVVDEYGEVIVTAGRALSADELRRAPVAEAVRASHDSGRCVLVEDGGDIGAVAALTTGSYYFGAVLLGTGGFPLSSVDLRTIERGAQVGTLLAMQRQAVSDAEHRRQGELLADLLDGSPDRRRDAVRRAKRLRVPVQDLDTLVLFAVPGEHRPQATRTLLGPLHSRALVGEYGGHVAVALSSRQPGVTVQRLHDQLRAALSVPVLSVSAAASGDLPAAVVTAQRTVRLLQALGAGDLAARAEDYHPYAAVFEPDPAALTAYLDTMVGPVRRYDAEHGTDLLATLRAFVRNQSSPTRTGRELGFHTNTILQRIERLTRLLGEGWRDDELFFRLSLAVRLDEIAERLRRL